MVALLFRRADAHGFPANPIRDAADSRAGEKRRRMDEDLRDAIVARTQHRRLTPQGVGACVLDNVRMEEASAERLPAYMAAVWRTWKDAMVLAVSTDAWRGGCPQEETVNYCFSDGERAAWGAPMVFQPQGSQGPREALPGHAAD